MSNMKYAVYIQIIQAIMEWKLGRVNTYQNRSMCPMSNQIESRAMKSVITATTRDNRPIGSRALTLKT
jgi:hypothetical protein